MDACKQVEVDWVDSRSWHGWTQLEETGPIRDLPNLLIRSVGFLFHEDDERIGLTTSMTEDQENVIDPLWIPKVAISEIRRKGTDYP